MDHFLRRPKLETAHEKPLAPRVDLWGKGGGGGLSFLGLNFLDLGGLSFGDI